MPQSNKPLKPRNKDSPMREATKQLTFTEASEGTGLATITATLARGNIINRNNRYYSATVLERAANEARERVENGEITGLMDHPDWWNDPAKGSMERVVIRWNRLYMEGVDLMGEGLILDTALGRDLMGLKQGGVHLALSTNAYAEGHFDRAESVPAPYDGDADDLIYVIDELELLTVDVVTDPSNVFAAIHAEAVKMRESYEKPIEQENTMNEEMKKLQEQADAAVKAATERAEKAEKALEATKREAVVQVAAARYSHLSEPVMEAMRVTAMAAETVEAAEAAIKALAESIPTPSNGSNNIPRAENPQAVFDPMREYRNQR